MKILLLFSVLINATFHLAAQTNDPNAVVKAMGLTNDDIRDLCSAAKGDMPNYYDWNVNAVYEIIYDLEGKPFPDFPSKREAWEFLKKVWDDKYSCVYCEITQSITGSLDMIGLYHENKEWVYGLYDPEGNIRAQVNKIRIINDYMEVKGTLVDYIEYVSLKRPTRQVESNPSFKSSLIGMRDEIIRFGGKRMSEMTPEEIEENSK
ncbi:MAG: hypothetical protein RIC80_06865 [Cyclobacteriaceae bacterium]